MSKPTPPAGPYRAIIFDLDGTAIPNARDGMPSQHLIDTVAKYRDRIHLAAATARPPILALPVIKALGLTDPCVISGGTIILDPITDKFLSRTILPAPTVTKIFALLHGRGYEPHVREAAVTKLQAANDPSTQEDIDIIFLAGVKHEDARLLKRQLETLPDVAANTAPDWSGKTSVMHITHRNATKEHAVADILQRANIDPEQAIGIGDGDGDTHLFAAVGLKVAMGNAGPALKAAADIIAPSVDQDGLADIIKRYAK